jgi:autotransporter-associated beta strand protein
VLAKSTNSTLVLSGQNTYSGGTTMNAGTLFLPTSGVLGSGTITANGGTLHIEANRADAVKVAGIVAGGGTVELHTNKMIIGGTRASVETAIRNARNFGAWNAPGLRSDEAATNPNHNTTLGVITGAEYNSVGGTGTFGNLPYGATDNLVKYTYYGDADFNGRVNFDDYVRTDNGFNNHFNGWINGDYDLNGVVNFDDYVLIDLAFNTQSGTLGRALSFLGGGGVNDNAAGGFMGQGGMNDAALRMVQDHLSQFGSDYANHFMAAVPEPTMVGVAGVVASVTMLSRRRRRVR